MAGNEDYWRHTTPFTEWLLKEGGVRPSGDFCAPLDSHDLPRGRIAPSSGETFNDADYLRANAAKFARELQEAVTSFLRDHTHAMKNAVQMLSKGSVARDGLSELLNTLERLSEGNMPGADALDQMIRGAGILRTAKSQLRPHSSARTDLHASEAAYAERIDNLAPIPALAERLKQSRQASHDAKRTR